MNELERTAVQLWEAKRLAAHEDVAHGRLVLLLLDNAAEISLMRSAKSRMTFAEMYGDLAYMLRDFERVGRDYSEITRTAFATPTKDLAKFASQLEELAEVGAQGMVVLGMLEADVIQEVSSVLMRVFP